jgi:hypothetical protein
MSESQEKENLSESQNDLDRPVWGVAAIGAVVGLPERQTHYQLSAGRLDADKLGGRWVSTPRRLLRQFAGKAA